MNGTAVAEAPSQEAAPVRTPDTDIMLIDLSSIAFPIWHMSQNEPDPNHTATATVARVRALASGRPRVAVCCDSGRTFRRELDPTYKANRGDRDERLIHQMKLAIETLQADGFPVWKALGFEADDLIASATAKALAFDGLTVTIVSGDKDLAQLVGPRVAWRRVVAGQSDVTLDAAAVEQKYGVKPEQMRDFLTLVGDSSDNVKGCPGVGEVTARKILVAFGSLDAMYQAFDNGITPQFTPTMRTKLQDFREQMKTTRQLIELRGDVAVPFDDLGRERVATNVPALEPLDLVGEDERLEDASNQIAINLARSLKESPAVEALGPAFEDSPTRGTAKREPVPTPVAPKAEDPKPEPVAAVADPVKSAAQHVVEGTVVASTQGPQQPTQEVARRPESLPMNGDFTKQLEPRTVNEAIVIANHMHASKLFSDFGTPQAVLSTIMAGREFGMPTMASLRAFHVIDGKPTLSAGAIQALILKSGKAKYFRCVERTAEQATFETQRGDDPPMRLTYTLAEGRIAFSGDAKAWEKSGWGRNGADMCVARAGTKLARLVYPDVVLGIYAREEFDGE